MHILVTGGAGFIGSHLVENHIKKGDKVHVVDDLSSGSIENILPFMKNNQLIFDNEDILKWPGLDKAVAWSDRIYHMAAVVGVFKVLEDQIKVLSVNISATEKLLQAAYNGKCNPQIVLASSSEVYGHGLHCKRFFDNRADFKMDKDDINERRKYTIEEFKEDMEPMVGSSAVSRWNYSISKLADETFGLSFARMYNMHVIVIRLFNTIGPRQTGRYGMVVPRFVKQAVSGSTLTVFGDGLQMRSFCDVRDTIGALDLLANNPESKGQIVNVGNSREITIKELAEMVKERAGSDSQIEYVPYDKAYGDYFEETYRRRPNLEKLYRLTNFKHQWTLEDTLDDLISRAQDGKLMKA